MVKRYPDTKVCKICGVEKPHTVEFFSINIRYGCGLEPRCKDCMVAKRRKSSSPTPIRRDLDGVRVKRCTRCGEEKPATTEYFYWFKAVERFDTTCKVCGREYRRQYYTENRDKISEYKHQHYTENREQRLQWNAENRDKIHQYYTENREQIRERHRQWCVENPDKVRVNVHRRRFRIANAPGTHTAEDIQLQVKSQTNKKGKVICWWCNNPIDGIYHIDHRIPLARGGSNNPENLCITCPTCNLSKHDKLPSEWNGRLL